MGKTDLNLKEDSGFGSIRNLTIRHILSRIKDDDVREKYLDSLKKEDGGKFKEFQEYLDLTEME